MGCVQYIGNVVLRFSDSSSRGCHRRSSPQVRAELAALLAAGVPLDVDLNYGRN